MHGILSSNNILQNGVLKGALAIKSLPQRVLREVAYGGHNLYEPHHTKNPTDDEFAYTHHHIVYKIPKKGDQDFSKLQNGYIERILKISYFSNIFIDRYIYIYMLYINDRLI